MSVESHDLGPVPNLTALSGYGDSYVVPGDEVYVVSEDTDYIYLNTGTNPPADGFNIIKAIFLPGVWQRRSSGGGAGALRYNTIAVGALGSGRLIDASLAGLVDGTSLAWVESVKDTWRWDATSTLTADNITVCNPTANGVNPGRFIRLLQPAPEWMQQVTWVIDAANSTALASDENTGLTAATPLLTDTERQRRMGDNPIWTQGEYHLRYISDVPAAQEVEIRNRTSPGAQIFLHGSMTDGAGQSTLFGPAVMGTITALNYAAGAGGQPWEMICATIPVSWSTAGPAGSSLIDKRGRVTAGTAANIGGKFYPIKDLAGAAPNAKARLAEPNKVGTYTAPFSTTNPSATFTPTAGDTFVIEKLTIIPNLVITGFGGQSSTVVNGVIIESLDYGNGGRVQFGGNRTIVSDGCIRQNGDAQAPGPSLADLGCQMAGNSQPMATNWTITNGYSRGVTPVFQVLTSGSITRFMAQAAAGSSATVRLSCARGLISNQGGGWFINQLGCWDSTTDLPIRIIDNVGLVSTATLWGGGNTFEPVRIVSNARLGTLAGSAALPNSYFFIQGGVSGAWCVCDAQARSSIPAFDQATSLYTAPRLLSQANLQATVAAAGFGGQFTDPVTGAELASLN